MGNKKTKCTGLIIRDRSLSAIEIEHRKKGPTITNYSKVLLEDGIVANGCIILNRESFQEAVKKLLANGVGGAIRTDEILVSLPEEIVFSHQVEIPREKADDPDFIKAAAKDFIPIELSKAVFDYKIVDEDRDKKTLTLNFIATQSSIAENIAKTLKEIRLTVTGMNVDIYCFTRSFHNSLNQTDGDSLLIDLNIEQDFFAVSLEKDGITKIISRADKKEMVDKIKALFNLSTIEEVREFLIGLRKGGNLSEEQKASLKNSFREYLDNLSVKIRQLISATESRKSVELHTIYLTGILSGLPGVEETIAEMLPEITIRRGIQYTEIPLEIEEDALQGIGLCMGNSLENDKSCFNLLPQNKKDEINLAKISPKLKILSIVITILLMVFSLQMSIMTARNYLRYKVSSQEVSIYNEQALNPYVTQVARIKQQQKQNEEQILSLLNNALPVSYLMSDLNAYNQNGVTMVNITYNADPSLNGPDISVRARAADRTNTEKFTESLKSTHFYEKVDSPLSNLVGKGERFISISLFIDKDAIIEAYKAQLEEPAQDDVPTPSKPTTPSEEIINTEENDV